MALSRSWAALAAAVAGACVADAAIVDAGTLTGVTTEALVFDDRANLPSGCPPVGCVGANTRDGITSDESRWSCAPSLDSSDSGCTITYTLEDEQHLEALKIALYQGDTRTRTIDISVDGNYALSWTSSGTTSDFESIDLGVDGKVVELVGDLQDSEWLSILEVEILVDDGDDGSEVDVVEAGELGTVTATADLYDDRLGDTVGCDPDGCTAALTRDGDMSEDSRWSCAPELGGLCSISYDLGAEYSIDELQLAMYQGDTRVRTVDVAVDGDLVTTWTSSGTTSGFESVDMSGATGQVVTITGAELSDSEWLSIVETVIMVYNGVAPPPSPTTPATPSPTLPPTTVLNPCLDSTSDSYVCSPTDDLPTTLYAG
ncbi:Likely pseudogene [Ectocarpus siliculosus]|nr:Likely pseudogene [Ectocarpus siliculosus]|eukprot:CBJ29586.1 Likely pseudogene [Ectocarpus siliculosus]